MNFGTVLVFLLGLCMARLAVAALEQRERRYLMATFIAHALVSVAYWKIKDTYYGGMNDADVFDDVGVGLARLLDIDPVRFGPGVLRLILHLDSHLPYAFYGEGNSTATMGGVAGLCVYLTGHSRLTMCFVGAGCSWFGLLCMYFVAREELEPAELPLARLAIFYVPSVMFWGGGFEKEAFSLGFLGILAFGTYQVFARRTWRFVPLILIGALGVGLIKAYTIAAFAVAVAVFVYARRASDSRGIRIRPGYLLLAALLGVGALLAVGALFPELSVTKVSETATRTREAYHMGEGGSDVSFGDAGPGGILAIPLSFINTFFRPTLVEVRNAPQLLAASEMTGLTLVALSIARARSGAVAKVLRSPFLLSSLAFALIFGVGVGLATGNLGSLARYRMPMLPLYTTALLVLRQRSQSSLLAMNESARWRPRALVKRGSSRESVVEGRADQPLKPTAV